MTTKLIASWIFGGILLSIGAWIMGHVEVNVGVSDIAYAMAIIGAFILILLGGLVWISVATATSKN
ncbi:MAG: hypothetical protein NTU57_00205 [Candidatus Aenigmarchaeota archaeon]|nr:hypothetical protein [Candidatus Aenigmarchaeota archaeon]